MTIALIETDLFSRKKTFDLLKEKIEKYKDKGGAIALHASWGMGKTWFAEYCKELLEKEHSKKLLEEKAIQEERKAVHLIDVSLNEHIQNPLEAIICEIAACLDNKSSSNVSSKGKEFLKKTLPILTSIPNEIVKYKTGINVKKYFEIIKEFFSPSPVDSMKDKVKSLKDKLKEFFSKDNPLTIFIDELDRCNPKFAIEFIECLKHFFEVPGLIFVLTVNYDQLKSDVHSIYGTHTDSEKYLEKFFLDYLELPEKSSFFEAKYSKENKEYGDKGLQDRGAVMHSLAYLSFKKGANFRQTTRILEQTNSLYNAWENLGLKNRVSFANPYLISYIPFMTIVDRNWIKMVLSKNIQESKNALKEAEEFFNIIKEENSSNLEDSKEKMLNILTNAQNHKDWYDFIIKVIQYANTLDTALENDLINLAFSLNNQRKN